MGLPDEQDARLRAMVDARMDELLRGRHLEAESASSLRASVENEQAALIDAEGAWDRLYAATPSGMRWDMISPLFHPAGAHVVTLSAEQIGAALPRFKGYSVTLVGKPVTDEVADPDRIFPWPAYVEPNQGFVMAVWRSVVRVEGNPLELHQVWRPGSANPKIAVVELERKHTTAQLSQIGRGIGLLRRLGKGRPVGSIAVGQDFIDGPVAEAVRKVRQGGKRPTTGAVLRQMRTLHARIDKGQFTRWYQALGYLRWTDVLTYLDSGNSV